jgi:hypothetical protein
MSKRERLDKVNKEYGAQCAQLGQIEYQQSVMREEARKITRALKTLNKEGFRLKRELEEEKNSQVSEQMPLELNNETTSK